MEYRLLGGTGVRVSRLSLGTSAFGAWGNRDVAEVECIVHAALDAGINLIDTADVYSDGDAERMIGRALSGVAREDVIVATKAHRPAPGRPHSGGSSRRWLIRACEESLRRLGTDWIDLYQLHLPDPACDIDETLGALTDLVQSGKIRYAGTSNFTAADVVEAQLRAMLGGYRKLVSTQPPYSILARAAEAELLPICQQYRVGVVTWGPLAGGWLSGRYRKVGEWPTGSRMARHPERYDRSNPVNQHKLAAVEQLCAIAAANGLTLIGLALAFACEHPAVTSVIIGPRTMDQLSAYLGNPSGELSADLLDQIDAVVAPGTTISPVDAGWVRPSLIDPSLRRRSARRLAPGSVTVRLGSWPASPVRRSCR